MKTSVPQSPETWVRYRKGLCAGCWAGCCTLPVEVRAHDIVRLGLATQEEVDFSLEDVARELIRRRVGHSYDAHERLLTLEQISGRDCIFLDPKTRSCTVYEKRPDTCRDFPLVGPRSGWCPYRAR